MTDNELGALYRRTLVRPRGTGGQGEDCPSPEALRSFVEHEVRDEERLAVGEHLAGCSSCQRDLALLAQVAGARPVRRSIVPRAMLAAAATVVLVLAGARVFASRGGETPVLRGEASGVTLVAPLGSVPAQPAPDLLWRAVEGAARYEVEVLGADASPVLTATARDTVLASPEGLVAGSAYRWRVTAVRRDGTRIESLYGRFELVRK